MPLYQAQSLSVTRCSAGWESWRTCNPSSCATPLQSPCSLAYLHQVSCSPPQAASLLDAPVMIAQRHRLFFCLFLVFPCFSFLLQAAPSSHVSVGTVSHHNSARCCTTSTSTAMEQLVQCPSPAINFSIVQHGNREWHGLRTLPCRVLLTPAVDGTIPPLKQLPV